MLTAVVALACGCAGLLAGAVMCASRHAEDAARLSYARTALQRIQILCRGDSAGVRAKCARVAAEGLRGSGDAP